MVLLVVWLFTCGAEEHEATVHKPVRQTSVITECWPVFLGLQPLQWALPYSEIKIWRVFWTGPSSEGHGPRKTDQSSCSVQQCWISWHGRVVKWWKEKQEAENLAQNPFHLLQLSAALRSNTLPHSLWKLCVFMFSRRNPRHFKGGTINSNMAS